MPSKSSPCRTSTPSPGELSGLAFAPSSRELVPAEGDRLSQELTEKLDPRPQSPKKGKTFWVKEAVKV